MQQLNLINEINQIQYTDEQKEFIEYSGKKSVILAATAGSGKTFSCVQRLKTLISRKINPEKIIFFSFTRAATEELKKRIGNSKIKITTIHAFALGILSRAGKFKKLVTFYDFLKWYKEKKTPSLNADKSEKEEFYELIGRMYDEAEYLSAEISAFKLQFADNITVKMPLFYKDYEIFLREKRSRDFSDILIEVRDMLKDDKWLKMFRGKYDYIFIDEYQDTSTIQLQILLALNAKYYYLIGDRNQSIYGYSGANCNKIELMLKARRETIEQTLSVNFRSDYDIVNNSNRFSSLKAKANSKIKGFVKKYIIFQIEEFKNGNGIGLIDVLNTYKEVAILARTNAVIKKIEFNLLKLKYPMKYFNYITATDIEEWRKGNVHIKLQEKLDKLKPFFNNKENEIIAFIERNKKSTKQVTSIHKSKGREFDYVVVVNSIDPFLIENLGLDKFLTKTQKNRISFDINEEEDVESKNIHYVAVSRAKNGLFYMMFDF